MLDKYGISLLYSILIKKSSFKGYILKFFHKINLYLGFEGDRDSYPDTFIEELNYQCSRVITFAAIISLSWLPYIFIDRALFPEEPFIVVLRIGFMSLGAIMLIARNFDFFARRSLLLITLYGGYLLVATAVLTGLTGGSPEYIGGFLFILTLTAVVPFPRRYAYVLLFSAVAAFFITGLARGMTFNTIKARYSLNDVLATTLVTSCFIYILDGIRHKSWEKSKKIEDSQKIILNQNRQIEKQMTLAGQIQQKLLPRDIPKINGAEISFKYYPMMAIGGDFLDILATAGSKGFGVFICDVSGHGLVAAFISSMVKTALTGWHEMIDSPSLMLTKIYDFMKGKMEGNFVTASISYIDTLNHKLISASAGHPFIIIAREKGGIDLVKPRGRVITDMMEPNYVEIVTHLDIGDKIILYTDGITEIWDESKNMYGDARLMSVVEKNSGSDPETICEEIFKSVNRFKGNSELMDDMTLVVIEYRGQEVVKKVSAADRVDRLTN